MKLQLKGGRVVDPANRRDEVLDIYIDGDRIAGLGRQPGGFKAARVVDAADLVVCPGFVDTGARLREPGAEHKATIESELEAAASAGFTTVCCTPDTSPVIDTPAVVELIHQRARGVRGARVRCIGALTNGLHGKILAEMHALKEIGCVGVSNAGRPIPDSAVVKHALAYAATLDLTVFLNAEDPWLGAQGCMHEGATGTRYGLPGIPASAELIGLARDLVLIEETGARAHFRSLSCADSVKYLRDARRADLAVTADVGVAHLTLCDEDITHFDGNYHVRPPLRTPRDRARLRKGLANGHIDVLGAQHEPHDADAKAGPFGTTEAGISGFDTFLPLMLALVAEGALTLDRAIDAAACRPARIVGVEGGSLGVGDIADICLFDPARRWDVTAQSLRSRGKNTPFLGAAVTGRVVMTLVGGRIVHELKH